MIEHWRMKMIKYLIKEDGEDTTLFHLVVSSFSAGAIGILSLLFVFSYIEMLSKPFKIYNLIAMTFVLIILIFLNKFMYNVYKFYYVYVLKRYRKVIENEREIKTTKR